MNTPSLFPSDARNRFIATTGDRYRHMKDRVEGKGLRLPFTLPQLREHILDAMGGSHGGALRCRYCGRVCDISEVDLDHAVPLVRGGLPDLSNIELPCSGCNGAKAEMTPEEFSELLKFLERVIPYARTDILKRLREHSKLLAGKRKAEILLRNQGQFPKKVKKQKPSLVMSDEPF
jgi:5-methylcytosine-specific restriction endonuclease McrA